MNKKAYFVLLSGSLLIFALAAILVSTHHIAWFDDPIRQFFYSLRNPGLNKAVSLWTKLGNPTTVTVFVIIIVILPFTFRKYGIPLACTAVPSLLIYKAAKLVFARPRPDEAIRLIAETGFSFPSGHTMNTLIIFGFLAYLIIKSFSHRRTSIVLACILVFMALSIALSRIYLGVHYPSDIVGGWSLGTACLSTAIFLYNLFLERRKPIGATVR